MDLYLVPVPCFLVEMFKMKMLAQDERLIEKDNCPYCHHSIPGPGYFFPWVRLYVFIPPTLQFLFEGLLLFCNHLN